MRVLVVTIALLCGVAGFAQKEFRNLLTQTIHVHTDSTKIRVTILAETAEVKPKDDRYYYSLKSGNIKRVKGMIVGKVLEGPFQEFDEEDNILRAGQFRESLMDGLWKTWYKSGELKSEAEWKKGVLHGKVKEFDHEGTLVCEMTYREGVKHGKCTTYENGVATVELYEEGQVAPQKSSDEASECCKKKRFSWLCRSSCGTKKCDKEKTKRAKKSKEEEVEEATE